MIEINFKQLRKAVKKNFPRLKIIGLDYKYWSVSLPEAKELIKKDKSDLLNYKSEKYDCDDFARAFCVNMIRQGYTSVGTVVDLLGAHAYNLIVTIENDNLQARLFEPQNDNFIEIKRKSLIANLFMYLFNRKKISAHTGVGWVMF